MHHGISLAIVSRLNVCGILLAIKFFLCFFRYLRNYLGLGHTTKNLCTLVPVQSRPTCDVTLMTFSPPVKDKYVLDDT